MDETNSSVGGAAAAWRGDLAEGDDSPFAFAGRYEEPVPDYKTLTYEVTGRVARITFNRPEHGNAITADTPVELADVVERADLDPRVHVMLLSGRGKGFCGGYDLSLSAENLMANQGIGLGAGPPGSVTDPVVQMTNHTPGRIWDPMVDYAMMSRFNRGFASLLHANKPVVAKIHGFCVAGGTDIALYADLIVIAADAKIGYPPCRVWGIPGTGMWAHRLGDQRAKRLVFTGDCLSGTEAAAWGLAIDAPEPSELDGAVEHLLARISAVPINQLMMAKLAMNSALLSQGVQNSMMISSVFDGIARHTREGYAFQQRAAAAGFKQAVRERDAEPFGDFGASTYKG